MPRTLSGRGAPTRSRRSDGSRPAPSARVKQTGPAIPQPACAPRARCFTSDATMRRLLRWAINSDERKLEGGQRVGHGIAGGAQVEHPEWMAEEAGGFGGLICCRRILRHCPDDQTPSPVDSFGRSRTHLRRGSRPKFRILGGSACGVAADSLSVTPLPGFIPELFWRLLGMLLMAGVKGSAVLLTARRSPRKLRKRSEQVEVAQPEPKILEDVLADAEPTL